MPNKPYNKLNKPYNKPNKPYNQPNKPYNKPNKPYNQPNKFFGGTGLIYFGVQDIFTVKSRCAWRGSIVTAAHAFRGGGARKRPYTCSKARR